MDLRFEPRSIKESYERERQHYQQQDDAGEENHDAESAPDVAAKSDVSETERAHHSKRPIESRNPGVLATFDVEHDEVKEYCENGDYRDQKQQILDERADILANLRLAEKVSELSSEKLHSVFISLSQLWN
jgi:hypothetical protein